MSCHAKLVKCLEKYFVRKEKNDLYFIGADMILMRFTVKKNDLIKQIKKKVEKHAVSLSKY